MLKRRYHAVVAGAANVIHGNGTCATAFDLVPLGRIGDGERKARVLILGSGAVGACRARLHRRGPGGYDAGATGAARPPNAGDENGWAERRAHRIMHSVVSDVVNLGLPTGGKLMLNAQSPLHGVGRVKLAGHNDVLRL